MDKINPNSAFSNQVLMDALDYVGTAASNRALSTPGLAIGTTSTSAVKIANTTTYLNAGQFYSRATVEVPFTAGVHDILSSPTSVQEQCYLVCLNAAGVASLVPGGIATGSGNALLPNPSAYAGLSPVGYVRIAVAPNANPTPFTGGTTALSAANLTVAYVNLGYLAPKFASAQ